ncbi:MAG: hypothetical protein V7637_1969 [Mycobacteriales bacterium]
MSIDRVPELVPVLSRGKHRSPRRGACFMELASYLAGERWSDHPECTHPLLAALARHVNDCTSDANRPRLAGLIPSVIGLTSDDPRLDARLTLRAATAALPIAAADRQRVMAVAVLTCRQVLTELDGRPPTGPLVRAGEQALAQVPYAATWARRYTGGSAIPVRAFRRHAAPSAVRYAVEGIARACVPDADRRLYALLDAAITDCREWLRPEPAAAPDPQAWAAACRLAGTTT